MEASETFRWVVPTLRLHGADCYCGNFSISPGTLEVMVTSLRARGTAHRRPPMPYHSWLVRFYMKEAIGRLPGLFEKLPIAERGAAKRSGSPNHLSDGSNNSLGGKTKFFQ
jgi:hypothetical protein